MMKSRSQLLSSAGQFGLIAALALAPLLAQSVAPIRPPATPLITHDPYFSIWSPADRLTDVATTHWTGTPQPLTGLIRIDGSAYRFIGPDVRGAQAAPMTQTRREITPTRTSYSFQAGGVQLDLAFFTPALPDDLDVLSRPLTYVIFDVHSSDSRQHQVKLYFDITGQIASNTPEERVSWSRQRLQGLQVLRIGTAEQPVLAKSGDNLRIDWGYAYLAVPDGPGLDVAASSQLARAGFVSSGALPAEDDFDAPAQTSRNQVTLLAAWDLGRVGTDAVSRRLMLAYDDVFAIQYFQRNLRPYWRRNGANAADLLKTADRDYGELVRRSRKFDDELTADLVKAGGPKYAALAVLTYRQTLAAHKLTADLDGTPLYFSKENFSNGCIDTVDVTYPSAPFFLLLNPGLLKAQLTPVFDYASLPRWKFPFAPHDLGTYPLANGQVYGGGERTEDRQMPVEESGNMLILTAALAKAEGNADYAKKYWPLLTRWADYLLQKGFDPENQLSTDDFAGHLAHNTNLSLKAILALRSYGMLAQMVGKQQEATKYTKASEEMARKWSQLAADGDHYVLAFDRKGTWSQKYNLVWDKILGFHLFPADIAKKEIAFYKTKQNAFGLPLDNRETYTKLDWILWTATLADNLADFESIAAPAYKFANETESRVPLSDWYWTVGGNQRGFQARSVVGGVYIKALADPALWSKWARRSRM